MTTTIVEPSPSTTPPAQQQISASDRRREDQSTPGRFGAWGPTLASALAVFMATLGLSPLFGSAGWASWPTFVIIVVALVGGGLGHLRIPLFLIPLLQAVAALAVLVRACDAPAPWGWLPTPDALAAVRVTLNEGLNAVDKFAPPVPNSAGVIAVTTLGVGALAIVVHVLVVLLRQPVLAGLALASMYAVTAFTLPDGAPGWSFVLAVTGWLIVMVADSRIELARWGRVLPRGGLAGADAARPGLAGPAFRLGAIALVIALAVPLLVPGLADAVLGGRGAGGGGPAVVGGAPDQVTLDPLVSLRRNLIDLPDTEILKYRTTASAPDYLRTVVLDDFDGQHWLPRAFTADGSPPVNDATPQVPGLSGDVARTIETTDVSSIALASPFVPLPYPVTRVNMQGDWHFDTGTSVVFSTTTSTRAATWQVQSLALSPTPAQLRQSAPLPFDVQNATSLRVPLPTSLVNTAVEVTAGTTTNYDAAVALQNWFRTKFTYSTKVISRSDADYLQEFLRDRVGYCEQFAATMALMARSLSIPARVAVGFTPGTKGADDYFTVRANDAHAWPELWFSGVGWVRFEPTPRSISDGGNVSVPGYTLSKPAGDGGINPGGATGDNGAGRDGKNSRIRQQESAGDRNVTQAVDLPAELATAGSTDPVDPLRKSALILILLIAVILASVPAVVRQTRRRRRLAGLGARLAEGAWSEMRDSVIDLGLPWSDARTPRDGARTLTKREHLSGEAEAAVTRIARATERARYAPTGSSTAQPGIEQDVRIVRQALGRRVSVRERWASRLLPRSVLRRN